MAERLQRGGYVVGEISKDDSGTRGAKIGDRWMSIPELDALVSQDSELEDKP